MIAPDYAYGHELDRENGRHVVTLTIGEWSASVGTNAIDWGRMVALGRNPENVLRSQLWCEAISQGVASMDDAPVAELVLP